MGAPSAVCVGPPGTGQKLINKNYDPQLALLFASLVSFLRNAPIKIWLAILKSLFFFSEYQV